MEPLGERIVPGFLPFFSLSCGTVQRCRWTQHCRTAASAASAASAVLSAEAQRLADLIQANRAGAGLPALRINVLLQNAAQSHADNMARQDRYGDDDQNGHVLDGQRVDARVAAWSYRWVYLGENVAYNIGYADPVGSLAAAWHESPAHQANIAGSRYTEMGVGVAHGASGRTYGVLVFGLPEVSHGKRWRRCV